MKTKLHFLVTATLFYFSISLVVQAQEMEAREFLERRWWGHGITKYDLVQGGNLTVLFELREVKVTDDLTVTARLVETFKLEDKTYERISEMKGSVVPSENKVELRDTREILADRLPSQFQWYNNNFSLKFGRNNNKEDGLAMSGSGYSGSSYLHEVWFQDSKYY